jgi:hypothetical protein
LTCIYILRYNSPQRSVKFPARVPSVTSSECSLSVFRGIYLKLGWV